MDPIGGDPGASLTSGGLVSLLDRGDLWLERHRAQIPLPASLLPTSRGLLLACLGLLLLGILPILVHCLLRRFRRIEHNFRGETILQSYGLVILLWSTALLAMDGWLLPSTRSERLRWLLCIAGFGALGFIDDTWGDKKIKGLRGHFRAAFQDRTITTGFVKAVGGAILACGLSRIQYPASWFMALLAAAVIALSANAVNLLDLRPGRAGAVFLLLAGLLLLALYRSGLWITGAPSLLYIVVPTLLVWQRDSAAQVMMGDTGSNLLGACLGLTIAGFSQPAPLLIALLLLIALHILAERISLTRLIEQIPFLRALDRWTGVR